MKKYLLTLAAGVSMAAFASAASAGSNNTVDLTQVGGASNVTNDATTDQTASGATYSEITIVQGNTNTGGPATVSATQGNGYDNQAYFKQGSYTPYASITASQDGDQNRLTATQDAGGGNQSIVVTQTGGAHNFANISQPSGSTQATVYQGDGGYHVLNSIQSGGSATLIANQYGSSNTIGNAQTASANGLYANIYQAGTGGYVFNTQNGGGNDSLTATQYAGGSNNQIYSTQSGHNGTVLVQQSNSNNLFVSTQNGSNGSSNVAGDNADVNQFGFGGQVYGYQAGNTAGGVANNAVVTQGGSYNVASYNQTGAGNAAHIHQ